MLHAHAVRPAGTWAGDAVDAVLIDYDRRHRRRITLPTCGGDEVLLDLPQAVRLRDGDGLELSDGRIIRVTAQAEPLLEIHAHGPAELVRIAWHLGNRHLPVQLLGERIRIRADHVIADMVHTLGGHARTVEAPFDPEGGGPIPAGITIITTTERQAVPFWRGWLAAMGVATLVGVLAAKILRDAVTVEPLSLWFLDLPWAIPGSALAVILPVTAACFVAARAPALTATPLRCITAGLLLATVWTAAQVAISPPHAMRVTVPAEGGGPWPSVDRVQRPLAPGWPPFGPAYLSHVDGFAAVLLAIVVPGRRPRRRAR